MIDLEVDASVLHFAWSLIVFVTLKDDFLTAFPFLELVWTIADGLKTVCLGILQRLGWDGQEGDVAKFVGEGGVRLLQRDFQCRIVDHVKSGKLGVLIAIGILQVIISLDVFKNRGSDLTVGGVGGE